MGEGIDWTYLASKSGEGIENLIATLLRRKYETARQTKPAKGDGGIDVLMDTEDGLVIWQVKKFTTAITDSQWGQIRKSWKRFKTKHVDAGTKIAKYYLVTPWTPTDKRIGQFDDLTDGVEFPTQWDGEAFINGLADQYPDTMERFRYGDAALERFVNSKATLASSPIERTNETTMLAAIEVRQDALDQLRNTLSDNYRIEHSQITLADSKAWPHPPAGSAAVLHRMTSKGDGVWSMQSLVPKTADAHEVDPISLQVEYLDPPGTPQHQAVRDWLEWGIPFIDVRARTIQRGGPFGTETSEESLISFHEAEGRAHPPLVLRVVKADGNIRMMRTLRTIAVTHGAKTGWLRIVAETPAKLLSFELRIKTTEEPDGEFTLGNVEGLKPASVLRESDEFLSIEQSDTFTLELDTGAPLVRGKNMRTPSLLAEYFRPIAAGLIELQKHTSSELRMPDVLEVEVGQFRRFQSHVEMYSGTPVVATWDTRTLEAPEASLLEEFKKELRGVLDGEVVAYHLERPILRLATSEYYIEHPIITTPVGFAPTPDVDIEALKTGDQVILRPGEDNTIRSQALAGWSRDTDVDFLPK